MTKKIDPLTGANYDIELRMYILYHGLTVDEAVEVMKVTESYKARDEKFNQITQRGNADETTIRKTYKGE